MNSPSNGSSLARTIVAMLGFLLIAGFFLQTEHRAHLFGILPFLFILACPLLHVFMHGGHGEHREQSSGPQTRGWRSHADHSGHARSPGGSQ